MADLTGLLPTTKPTGAAPAPPASRTPAAPSFVQNEPRGQEAVQRYLATGSIDPQPQPGDARTWGRTGGRFALEIGLPLALAILSRGASIPAGLRIAGSGAAGTALGSLEAERFDPSLHPYREAGRKALVGLGATALPGLVPAAPAGAGLFERLVTGVSRAGAAGAGAAGGSAAAELIDPTPDPRATARTTGAGTAAGQSIASLIGTALGPSRHLTPLGREAAETLRTEKLPIPPAVSESQALNMAGNAARYSMVGGRLMQTAERRATEKITGLVDDVVTGVRQGRTADEMREATGKMHEGVRDLVRQRLTTPTRPVYLGQDAQETAENLLKTILPAQQRTPVEQSVAALAAYVQAHPVLPYKDVPGLMAQAAHLERLTNTPGIYITLHRAVQQLSRAIQAAPASEAVVDTRPIQGALQQFATWAEDYIPTDILRGALRRISQVKPFLTFEEAKDLRTTIGDLARAARGGGASAAPTALGGPVAPGRGGPFGNLRGGALRSIYGAIDQQMEQATNTLGADVTEAWRAANAATRLQKQSEFFAQGIHNAKEGVTGLLDGRKFANWLFHLPYAQDIYDLDFPPEQVQRLDRLSKALAFSQGGQSVWQTYLGEAPSVLPQSMVGRVLGPAAQVGSLVTGAQTGHPILGFLGALTPEVAGAMLASPRMSALLTLGLQMQPQSREYAALVSRLAGLAIAENFVPQTSPAPAGGSTAHPAR